jgi:hypothetical protein
MINRNKFGNNNNQQREINNKSNGNNESPIQRTERNQGMEQQQINGTTNQQCINGINKTRNNVKRTTTGTNNNKMNQPNET